MAVVVVALRSREKVRGAGRGGERDFVWYSNKKVGFFKSVSLVVLSKTLIFVVTQMIPQLVSFSVVQVRV